jgi:hypothetical protein
MLLKANVRLAFVIIATVMLLIFVIFAMLPYANPDWDDLKKSQYQTATAVFFMTSLLFYSLYIFSSTEKDSLSIIEKYQMGYYSYDSKGKLKEKKIAQLAQEYAEKGLELTQLTGFPPLALSSAPPAAASTARSTSAPPAPAAPAVVPAAIVPQPSA